MALSHDSPELDKVFLALSSPKRRGMLHTLAYRPATVSQLADEYEMSLPAIHKHINVLEDAELIIRRKAGRTNFVALNKKTFRAVQRWIIQYHTEWGNDEETLENYIAGMQE
ncbi:MAG TPA: winged helix-turn-helix domain-containing protein [Candidatus Saccharimonadales bacterium]|nr:winged helix-turn-helix domain-containing protein [Candidatus Saccharimonadales bacterium]